MRVIIRVIKRQTTDDEALEIKKGVQDAVKKYEGIEVTMNTMD